MNNQRLQYWQPSSSLTPVSKSFGNRCCSIDVFNASWNGCCCSLEESIAGKLLDGIRCLASRFSRVPLAGSPSLDPTLRHRWRSWLTTARSAVLRSSRMSRPAPQCDTHHFQIDCCGIAMLNACMCVAVCTRSGPHGVLLVACLASGTVSFHNFMFVFAA